MQLFAIISKQDEGTSRMQREFVRSFLSSQLNQDKVREYMTYYEKKAGFTLDSGFQKEIKLTSMKDSIRSVALCRKINKKLTRKQKVVVLVRLFELLKSDGRYTEQGLGIIHTAADVFNISAGELDLISFFIREDDPFAYDHENMLVIQSPDSMETRPDCHIRQLAGEGLDGSIRILWVKSVDLLFVRYQGKNYISLNGRSIEGDGIHLLAPGSIMRLPQGSIYYSDIINRFMSGESQDRISFQAEQISYTFPNGTTGLNPMSLSEESGLVGIMGASGSGKTTLLHILSGQEKPDKGHVRINGVDIYLEPGRAEGLIGFISQDDLLIEELTVHENLLFNARLCFRDMNHEQLEDLVQHILHKLGLSESKDIKVGNPLNKRISGGQRKRLNIALELIREPSVLFVDEPTSGLSSRDSENVMDLLKVLSRNGKLIFVVIHQPSSDIYKMFDRLIIMDTGGYPVYYGNPIEAVMYFKKESKQINAESGECSTCGNVNPELLFDIIEAHEVDDFGNYTNSRIKTPSEWYRLYSTGFKAEKKAEVRVLPKLNFQVPGWLRQLGIFIQRDLLTKASNLQYIAINLLESPLLALLLAVIIKYRAGSGSTYLFRENENIPPYLFMSIIVALFIGLSVSAEEIFRDRKILKREAFLNLSRSSYLFSKIIILFCISGIQTLGFVFIGNSFLEIKGMVLEYWLMLWSVSFFANILGLNISSAFNSVVTIYILIPLLVIPQMILGGAMFSFDKLNDSIGGGKSKSPIVADVMVSRWAYEALAVKQFTGNTYASAFYQADRIESMASYKQAFYIPELNRTLGEIRELTTTLSSQASPGCFQASPDLISKLTLLRNEIRMELAFLPTVQPASMDQLMNGMPGPLVLEDVEDYLRRLNQAYSLLYKQISHKKEQIRLDMNNSPGKEGNYQYRFDKHHNEFLADVVKNTRAGEQIVVENERLVQVIDPVYLYPSPGLFSLRTHFFTPVKYLAGKQVDTYWFNLLVILSFSIFLYLTLYYDLLKKVLKVSGNNR